MTQDLNNRLKSIRLVVSDVDGVMTDGSFYIGENVEMKQFHSNDGLASVLLRLLEFPMAVISGRHSAATLERTRALKIPDDLVYQSSYKKIDAYNDLKKKFNLKDEEIAYIGDDYIDHPILERCGVSFAPANAVAEIKEMVDHVTTVPGGKGALREMVNMILVAQGRLQEALDKLYGLY